MKPLEESQINKEFELIENFQEEDFKNLNSIKYDAINKNQESALQNLKDNNNGVSHYNNSTKQNYKYNSTSDIKEGINRNNTGNNNQGYNFNINNTIEHSDNLNNYGDYGYRRNHQYQAYKKWSNSNNGGNNYSNTPYSNGNNAYNNYNYNPNYKNKNYYHRNQKYYQNNSSGYNNAYKSNNNDNNYYYNKNSHRDKFYNNQNYSQGDCFPQQADFEATNQEFGNIKSDHLERERNYNKNYDSQAYLDENFFVSENNRNFEINKIQAEINEINKKVNENVQQNKILKQYLENNYPYLLNINEINKGITQKVRLQACPKFFIIKSFNEEDFHKVRTILYKKKLIFIQY